MIYGEKIKELRKKNGMTQVELSQKLGISVRTISRYETNKVVFPDISIFDKLAKEFDVEINSIYISDDLNCTNNDSTDEILYYMVYVDAVNCRYGRLIIGLHNELVDYLKSQKKPVQHGNIQVKYIEFVEEVLELMGFGGYGIMSEETYVEYFEDYFEKIFKCKIKSRIAL